MSKRLITELPRYCLLAALCTLYGCDTSATGTPTLAESNSASSEPNTSSLNDLTNYTQLFGSISPFERITISAPFESPSIQIDYTNVDSNQIHSQIAMRNSDGKYNFLALPVSEEGSEYVEVSSNGTVFGQVSLLPLGLADPDYIPGQFALDAMNSILMGLRDDVVSFENSTSSDPDGEIVEQRQKIADALRKSVDQFQSLISLMDDSVVFNSPIVDPNSGVSILDSRGLGVLDSIYLKLLDNFSSNSLFLDEESGSQGNAILNPRLSFAQINNAATERFATRDGINALASLTMYSRAEMPDSGLNQFVYATSLVSAGLIPAIVANYAKIIEEPQSLEYLSEATSILNIAKETSGFEYSFMYSGALETLQTLVRDISAP